MLKMRKIIDIVSYALEMSVNGVTCVFVVHFRAKIHLKCVNWLNSRHPCVHQNMCDWQKFDPA